jgi:hypothetical protein
VHVLADGAALESDDGDDDPDADLGEADGTDTDDLAGEHLAWLDGGQ